jgi:RNA polymerase sigma-70 factor (ECF subfamily)
MDPNIPGDAALAWPQSIAEFDVLVNVLQHRLVQFAFCRLGNLEDAEDVVQDVLVQAYRNREKHRHVDNAIPFLFRMVANRCTDYLRRRTRERRSLEERDPEVAGFSAGGAADSESAEQKLRRINGLLGRLPARQAEAIRLRVHGELSFEAVAHAVGCSVPTVKSRFRYGIEKLRKALTRQGGER